MPIPHPLFIGGGRGKRGFDLDPSPLGACMLSCLKLSSCVSKAQSADHHLSLSPVSLSILTLAPDLAFEDRSNAFAKNTNSGFAV